MRRAARAGFTLLEVVLAMTALALISAICYGAFHVGMRAVAAGTCAVTTAQRLRVASDVFTRQIRSVEPFPDYSGAFEEVYFRGRADSVRFVTSSAQLGGGGLALVTYQIEPDTGEQCGTFHNAGQRLVLTEVPYFSSYTLDLPDDQRLARRAVLLSGVEGLSFDYFGGDSVVGEPGCDDTGWCKRWNTSDSAANQMESVPIAMRLMVQRVPGVETESWGQETPIAISSYYNPENREANLGLSLQNDDHGDDEGLDDDDDTGGGAGDDADDDTDD
jgi:prepilin-type N-terminal cleavage/methylation domain-containing protein